ncbi:pyridoxamine 5'-phosphate oxidase [Ehrlichia chaffeensis str. Heartland]|uniref:Pyridoxine/pyridoxamine 5'-phosphate oxidase n=1 Tax=Ehrlichia chaffeensis (strain ATCC CRL-10679 / Arkansas) TaxID=205920 RepID=PDXH_EHRCR|nr:pyridoxamine 5'-phosphate oxidase [Ehrlichia chaffeensis]Q2GFR2.1 RecName: Full=Pyridoxine/pyridoxamine 5'-phosphate oxidase; AltName: Full=PNP/PMP oxidase; Short=PNPOx; AltName: Full=Pyridoxal 5'-phosphate synthase [Ehrlichia chaffeensis str. Arkansas]ABD44514.1 pyridoxamine 5'-phosphate oxidase [Ehrlichia chaffeensis str. Arkansas]AHX03958.1 pyridoxamine 5'-phosphate oxidase [Ehrlichia chaffeensis str. Heartland]AHX05310.1 pyridoxamine 5'-phosphate oxidase [Ehrlichia chaffeensis str. Jax]
MIKKDPIELFDLWYNEVLAVSLQDKKDPTAMVLATCSKDLKPSARVVLLKKYSDQGFVFFTNMNSRKGKEMAENPSVALVFDWSRISKQVRIEGRIKMLPCNDADEYYASRPRGSQIGAWCSKQSSVLENREDFVELIKEMTIKFHEKPIPRPDYWVGIVVVPMLMEFWQEGLNRIHTRYQYTRDSNNMDKWNVVSLYP